MRVEVELGCHWPLPSGTVVITEYDPSVSLLVPALLMGDSVQTPSLGRTIGQLQCSFPRDPNPDGAPEPSPDYWRHGTNTGHNTPMQPRHTGSFASQSLLPTTEPPPPPQPTLSLQRCYLLVPGGFGADRLAGQTEVLLSWGKCRLFCGEESGPDIWGLDKILKTLKDHLGQR